MISIMALRAGLLAALAAVQGLSIVSAGDRTNVLIETDGAAVTFEHQMLSGPPRIVVDVSGSSFALPQRRYLDINRGGVLSLRSSQYQTGIVRVVIDLAESVDYEIERAGDGIRISFLNPGGAFEPWTTEMAAGPVVAPASMEAQVRAQPQEPQDRAVSQVPVSRPPVVEPQAPQMPQITVEFRNTPIVDVLNTFADFSDRSIVPGLGIQNQEITAAIRNQPWDEAMRAILEGQGLTATELGSGIIMVTSLSERRQLEEQEEIITEAFQLQYVTADSIADQVQELLAQTIEAGQQQQRRSVGNVAVNAATNSLIVSARQSALDRLRPIIDEMDKPTPQVTVQVRILSIRRSQFEGLGVHYEFKDRFRENGEEMTMINRVTPGWQDANGDGLFQPGEEVEELPSEQVNLTGTTVAAVGNALERLPQSTFDVISTLILGRWTLVTWLDAVERLELAELQADPVITVRENRTARIHVGERTPIRVVDQGAAGAQGPQAQVRVEQTGVILELTPRVVGANKVNIALHAERSEIQSFSADAGYVFGTSETDTEIMMDDGQTAVISGLTTTDLRNTQQGIPILMNLPVIGALFRNTYITEEKEDLLIMVTPYIDRSEGF